jgi:hypothetical protein
MLQFVEKIIYKNMNQNPRLFLLAQISQEYGWRTFPFDECMGALARLIVISHAPLLSGALRIQKIYVGDIKGSFPIVSIWRFFGLSISPNISLQSMIF